MEQRSTPSIVHPSRVLGAWTRHMLDETVPSWREPGAGPPVAGLRAPTALSSGAWFIPHADMVAAWRAHAEAHADPLYGLHFAERWTLSVLGPITRVVSFAPTLGHVATIYREFDRLLDSNNLTTLAIDRDHVVLCDRPPAELAAWPRQLAESILGGYVHVTRTLTAGRVALHQVDLMHEEPPCAGAVEDWFQAPVRWSAPVNRLVADAGVLSTPMWSSSRDAFASVQRKLVELRQRLLPGDTIVARVRSVLLGAGEDLTHARSLGEVASTLGMSARTLQRRLGAAGVSFRRLVDDVRSELLDGDPSAKRIALARRLGFSDDSALRKFLRRASSSRRD